MIKPMQNLRKNSSSRVGTNPVFHFLNPYTVQSPWLDWFQDHLSHLGMFRKHNYKMEKEMNESALHILSTFPIHSCILTQPHNTTETSLTAPVTCHLPVALDIIHFLLELSTVFYIRDTTDLLEIMLFWLFCVVPSDLDLLILWFSFYILSLDNLISLCGSIYHLYACDCTSVFLI